MFISPEIDDVSAYPSPARIISEYAVNIRPDVMEPDLEQFQVYPKQPARHFYEERNLIVPKDANGKLDYSKASLTPLSTIFLVFPDVATAKASSLGKFWKDLD